MLYIFAILIGVLLSKSWIYSQLVFRFALILSISTTIILYDPTQYPLIGMTSILSGCALLVVLDMKKTKRGKIVPATVSESKNRFRIPIETTEGRNVFIQDVRLGVLITGGSGSGKTKSAARRLLKHFAENNFSGIMHDYKEFELTEFAYPFFKDTDIAFSCFCPTQPNYSARLNVFHPDYLKGEADVDAIVGSFIINVIGKEPTDDTARYFYSGAKSLMGSVLWRLKESFPERCNLPYLIAFINAANHTEYIRNKEGERIEIPFGKLKNFLRQSPRAEMIGATFLQMNNPKELNSLVASLTSYLQILSDPRFFYLLSGNDFMLDINAPNNRRVISFVNTPSTLQSSVTPLLGAFVESVFQNISAERNRDNCFVLLEEAPRLKVQKLGSRVSTLREYGVSFIYMMQDKVQSKTEYDGKDYYVKETLTNLSTQLFGKANDPETAKYYEGFIEEVKEKQFSKTSSAIDFTGSDARTTTSEREKKKFKSYEFIKLRQGEFYFISGQKDRKIRFTYNERKVKKEMPPKVRNITEQEMVDHYLFIIEDAKEYFYSNATTFNNSQNIF